MKDTLHWLGQHWLDILFVGFIVRFGKLLFQMLIQQPLQGEDGKTSMDEFAKYMLVVYLGWVLYQIGQGATYPPEIVLYLVLGVALIAGLKPLVKLFMKAKENESSKTV